MSPYNVHELRLSLNKDNRQAWNDRLLDNSRREVSPQSEIRTSVTKSKNSLRLPVIKLLNKAIMKKAQENQPTSLETSFVLHEKEKERSSKIYKRVESFQRKDENRNRRSDAKENPLSKTIDVCNEPGEDEEKEPNIKNVHRPRPITVHKKREPVKILLQNEIELEKPKEVIPIQEEKVEKGQGNREWRRVSHMTLTSAYNSNESLIDYREGNWDNEEDSEKRIKEIVEKHVEDAYKSIDIIKRNFQMKSKTYLFHIDRDSCE